MEDQENILQEANLSRIRNLVNLNKIKLWLDPYYDQENGSNDSKLLESANTIAMELEMDDVEVYQGLKKLQSNALEKLKARETLNQSGQIELKLKLDKHIKTNNPDLKSPMMIKIDIYHDGEDLAEMISKEINVPKEMFKLVSAGSVIKTTSKLAQQNLKPGQTVMVLTVDQKSEAVQLVEEQRRILNTAKEDAELLGSQDEMTIADQNGKQVELPKEERKAIIIAMSLHEKGRAAMKKSNYTLAIILLLEAKDEYQRCSSQLLSAVDNYGLLNLDIAWCYLQIGNLSELPNAQESLKECERNFTKNYGANLERVKKLKGTASSEEALLVRLHLLQAISAFISGHKDKAVLLFQLAKDELKKLKVPEDALEEVMAQGFTKIESRLALRACSNNPTLAVKHAHESKKRKLEEEKAERERNKKRHKLGKTVDGSWVNLGYLKTLVNMGYQEELAAKALRHTDNDLNQSIETMNENPALLLAEYNDEDREVTKEMIETVANMGFPKDLAETALKRMKGNIAECIDMLTKNPEKVAQIMEKREIEQDKIEEARNRMEEDLGGGEDHLDISLNEEEDLLIKYGELLGIKI